MSYFTMIRFIRKWIAIGFLSLLFSLHIVAFPSVYSGLSGQKNLSLRPTFEVADSHIPILLWDFDDEDSDPSSPTEINQTYGDLSITANTGTSEKFDSDGNGGNALYYTSWDAADLYYEIQFSAKAYQNLILSFDHRRTDTGPESFSVEYSTDEGDNFVTLPGTESGTAIGEVFSSSQFDLSSITELNGNENVILRLATLNPASGASGRFYLDNLTIEAEPIIPDRLAIVEINGGELPVQSESFDVIVEAQNENGQAGIVGTDTQLEIQKTAGDGSGEISAGGTGTIPSGDCSAAIPITYSTDETGVVFDVSATGGMDLTSYEHIPITIIDTEPELPVIDLSASITSLNSVELSWTRESPTADGVIILGREDEVVDEFPVDGTHYAADLSFEGGDELGNENFVVYQGTSTTITVTDLKPGTTYYFSAFEYNGTYGTENYLHDPTPTSIKTCIRPDSPPGDILFSNATTSSFTISWNNNQNQYTYVLMNSENSFTAPTDGLDPGAFDNSWNDSGEQLVYAGTAGEIAISGVGSLEDFYFRLYSYNCSDADLQYSNDYSEITYKTALFNENFQSCPLSGWNTILISGNQWECANGRTSITGLGAENPTESWLISPLIDFSLIDNEMLSFDYVISGEDGGTPFPQVKALYSETYPGTGNPNIYSWQELEFSGSESNTNWQSSGLIDLSEKNANGAYLAFKYNSSGFTSGNTTEWKIDHVLIEERACTSPNIQASEITISNLGSNQADISWTSGDGFGRTVVVSNSNQILHSPTNGTSYSGNSIYENGEVLGEGHYVVYSGTENSVNVSGLKSGFTYSVKVFEYNECATSGKNYNMSDHTNNPASFTTQDNQLSDVIVNKSFTYPSSIAYKDYQGNPIDQNNSLEMAEFVIRDRNDDGKPTLLSAIDFQVNGYENLHKVALYDGSTKLREVEADDDISFASLVGLEAGDGGNKTFSLRCTFNSTVNDNEQISFIVTDVEGGDINSTQFASSNGGGASTSIAGDDNRISVIADRLAFESLSSDLYVDVPFDLKLFAVDENGSIDEDASGQIDLNHTGSGVLDFGGSASLINGEADFSHVTYNKSESIDITTDSEFGNEATLSQSFERTLVQYDFTGYQDDNDGNDSPSWMDESVASSEFALGSDANPLPFPAFDVFSAKSFSSSITTPTDNYYLELTLSPSEAIDLSAITFKAKRSGSGPQNLVLRSNADEFSADINDQIVNVSENFTTVSFPLSEYENLTEEITFRMYLYNGSHGNGTVQFDDLVVKGAKVDDSPPEFSESYPKAEIITSASIDFSVSATETGNVYYTYQESETPSPTSAEVMESPDGTVNIEETNTEYTFYQEALSASQAYDFYFVLEDLQGNYSSEPSLLNVTTSNLNSSIADPVSISQVASSTLPSIANSSDQDIDVFAFSVNNNSSEAAHDDGLPTKVNKIVLEPGGSNEANWLETIAGVRVRNGVTDEYITIADTIITSNSIEISFAENVLEVANNESLDLICSIWLKESQADRMDLQFAIPGGSGNAHSCLAIGQNSSQFATEFSDEIASNIFAIDVIADQLRFSDYPGNVSGSFGVTVSATDENGNIDLDMSGEVSLSKHTGAGDLNVNNPSKSLTNGVASWTEELDYTGTDYFSIAAIIGENELMGTSGLISAGAGSLIVSSGETFVIESDLNVMGDVIIQENAELILNNGVSLILSGDFQNSGMYTDNGGTLHLGGSVDQTISSNSKLSINNLTISNSNSSVINESDIDLSNTLKLNTNAVFDTDGSGDDKEFVLLSNASGTARIAKVESGASLSGSVTMERFIHDQPAKGWYFLTTPIKDQDVTDWQDDVKIQGMKNSNPNAQKVLYYYDEPTSTNTQSGSDGWLPVMSSSDPASKKALDLYIFNSAFKGGSLKIDNKGEPFIGDGNTVDGTYSIPLDYTSTSFGGGGWNLVVNPYPCEIDWNAVDKTEGVTDAYYMWNPIEENYTTYANGTSVNGSSPYIASGRAFFVKANQSGQSITFSEDDKSTQNGGTFIRQAAPQNILKIKLIDPSGSKDEMAIRLDENATNNFDSGLDAQKMKANLNIYSKSEDHKSLVINTLNADAGVISIPIEMDIKSDGRHQLRFEGLESILAEKNIYLKDELNDRIIRVNSDKTISSYFRKTQEDHYHDRFKLLIANPLYFDLSSDNGRPDDRVSIEVKVEKFKEVSELQMQFSWDPNLLSFEEVSDTSLPELEESDFDLTDLSNGNLGLKWSGEEQSLNDSSSIFTLNFRINGNADEAVVNLEASNLKAFNKSEIELPALKINDGLIDIWKAGRVNGLVKNELGSVIENASVKLLQDDSIINENSSGQFDFNIYQNSQYSLSVSSLTEESYEGIELLDVVKIRQYLAGLSGLENAYRMIAADVDESKSIDENDINYLKEFILGRTNELPLRKSWIFVPQQIENTDDPFNLSSSYPFEYQDSLHVSFTGIRPGDVNLSHLLPTEYSSDVSIQSILPMLKKDESDTIRIYLNEPSDLVSFQMDLAYDPKSIEIVDIQKRHFPGTLDYHISAGNIRMIWESGNGQPYQFKSGQEVMVNLIVEPKKDIDQSTNLISFDHNESFAVDDQLQKLRINYNQKLTGLEADEQVFTVKQNKPNPFNQSTSIEFYLPESDMVYFKISNVLGKTIYEVNEKYESGWNTLDWTPNQKMKSGVYLYSISAGQHSTIKKMMKE